MNAELDYDLTQEQWKTLRALRLVSELDNAPLDAFVHSVL